MNKELIIQWLKAGAIYQDGVLLFKKIHGNRHPLLILLKEESRLKALVLKQVLRALKENDPVAIANTPEPVKTIEKPKLREDFAFLSDPDCPAELKILAADKITAYHNYVSGHEKLFDATSKQEQFDAVKFTVENFMENRRIIKELEHYKKHKKILGDHRIFKSMERVQELRKLNVLELVKLQGKLNQNIWRIKSELAKKDKRHLDAEREASIRDKQFELTEIKRILEGYE